MCTKLCKQIDGTRFVRYERDMELLFAWLGGHGIHVFSADGKELDYHTVGDCARNEATLDEVVQGVQEILDYYREVN